MRPTRRPACARERNRLRTWRSGSRRLRRSRPGKPSACGSPARVRVRSRMGSRRPGRTAGRAHGRRRRRSRSSPARPRSVRRKAGGNPLRVIARGIIDNENFEVHSSLAQHAFDANGYESRIVVIRDDHPHTVVHTEKPVRQLRPAFNLAQSRMTPMTRCCSSSRSSWNNGKMSVCASNAR